MKEKILSIASDLREGSMSTDEAVSHLKRLFSDNPHICDCEIPKPKDAYHELDKNICRDCNGEIKN